METTTKTKCVCSSELKSEKYHWHKNHQPKIKPYLSKAFKKMYAEGYVNWKVGKTKENDERVRKQSESLKKHWQENEHPKPNLGKKASLETRKLMSSQRIGSKNGNWKGGLTVLKRGMKRSWDYTHWRREVLKHDNHICRKCGKEGSRVAHHILSYQKYTLYRFDVNNGITLCNECHLKTHRLAS
ncbi:MAG: hypothetical protein Q7K54_02800 [Candidatus Parcubacteria bacterium]|nr:hypothetical protein [Candidatus Parcubacteria bacterium]